MNRRSFLKLLGIGAAAVPVAASAEQAPAPIPNDAFTGTEPGTYDDWHARTFSALPDRERLLEALERHRSVGVIEYESRDILRHTVSVRAHLLTAGHAIHGVEFTREVLREIMENTRLPVPVDNAGWVTALEVVHGTDLWADAELTPEAAEALVNRTLPSRVCAMTIQKHNGQLRLLEVSVSGLPFIDGLEPIRL